MKRIIQHEPLLVQQLEMDRWTLPMHSHNHFELILVQTGSGNHTINGNRFAYRAGDVFLLSPSDSHSFVIEKRTRFYCLSFTDFYLAHFLIGKTNVWLSHEASGWRSHQSLIGSLVTNPTEQRHLLALAEIIAAEQDSPCSLFSNPVVESLMKTILSLLDRQLAQRSVGVSLRQATPPALIQRIVAYVCQHISEPNLLRMDKMADVFNYSPSHLGALFKQHAGESIQQYIIRYKLKLVETRLSLSTMTISQIADEFGFSDVCHLNKLFKRHYQHTPTNYRRAGLFPAT